MRVVRTGFSLACIALACLALAEVLVRAWAMFNPRFAGIMQMQDPALVKIEPHGQLGYRPRPNAVFPYRNGTAARQNALAFRGPVVARVKAPGTRRVVILGGSSAHGWGVDNDDTIDARLRLLLAERLPGVRVEVINLAFDGYDSYQDYERLRSDGIPLQPDIVVVHSGINDVRNARFQHLIDRDPRTMLWSGELARLREEAVRGGPTLVARAKGHLYVLRLVAHVRQDLRRRRDPTDLMHPGDSAVFTPNLQAADYFERNLERVLGLRDTVSFTTILSVPPSSLHARYAPGDRSVQSYWVNDAATTQMLRDTLATRMARVAAARDRPKRRVLFVVPAVPAEGFQDDCHLTPEGNQAVAAALADSIVPLLGS
jgi:lysophospholipase L1-like esterase